ncbi:Mov34/MPN/PAD-1 family protein [Flavisolibacter sp. BT320]|nr:Mov34/MPN/PAD-1 family protein [Flavisolibacter longurius]
MDNDNAQFPVATDPIDAAKLQVQKAIDFAHSLPLTECATLIKCLTITEGDDILFYSGDEIVVFEVAVDVGPRPVHDIRYTERMAVLFTSKDQTTPWVFALRKNFPPVLHRISLYFEQPTCLCIYETPYEELKLEWRPQRFLQDIRNWLALTAEGKLHQDDQPLEPLLIFNQGRIILPPDLKLEDDLFVMLRSARNGKWNFLAGRQPMENTEPFHSLILIGALQEHGILDSAPMNLQALHQFALRAGIDLLALLQEMIIKKLGQPDFLKKKLLVLLQLPKKGEGRGQEQDFYVFLTSNTLEEIGCEINALARESDHLGAVFPAIPPSAQSGIKVPVQVLIPYFRLDKNLAHFFSGYPSTDPTAITIAQIGVGALGSQLFMNLAKTRFGRWKLIDDDIFLPHNGVRHHLHQQYAGLPKCQAMAHEANELLEEKDMALGIWEDYLFPADRDNLTKHLQESNIILDLSTSIPVARDLAFRRDLKGKRVSMFLNPMGSDLVILAEDAERRFPLDVLEFQYYRALMTQKKLVGHLDTAGTVRYSNSCRDTTSRIPQDYVALHAAISSSTLKKLAKQGSPMIGIWRIKEDMAVEAVPINVEDYVVAERGAWLVYIDCFLIDKISEARLAKLPNETGGILIGGYDFERKRIYLVDSVLSPKDSEETPTGYVRGREGLKEVTARIHQQTANHLVYAGEWHSHPEGCSLKRSDDDEILFAEIKTNMTAIGYPPLMLIAGDNKKVEVYIE